MLDDESEMKTLIGLTVYVPLSLLSRTEAWNRVCDFLFGEEGYERTWDRIQNVQEGTQDTP